MSESADFIDYTLLQKKGILNRARALSNQDSTRVSAQPLMSDASASFLPPSSAPIGNPFALLDSATNSPQNEGVSSYGASTSDTHALGLKLEDVEYKLARLVEQLALIESKLDTFERKVSG